MDRCQKASLTIQMRGIGSVSGGESSIHLTLFKFLKFPTKVMPAARGPGRLNISAL
jgi:hypothetical protein